MAVGQAHAQPVDVAAHHREPRQHDHQHGELGERGARDPCPGRADRRGAARVPCAASASSASSDQPLRVEAQHAEQHRHQVEQRERRARRPGVIHDVGEEQDRGADLLGGEAGIGEAQVEAGAEQRVRTAATRATMPAVPSSAARQGSRPRKANSASARQTRSEVPAAIRKRPRRSDCRSSRQTEAPTRGVRTGLRSSRCPPLVRSVFYRHADRASATGTRWPPSARAARSRRACFMRVQRDFRPLK